MSIYPLLSVRSATLAVLAASLLSSPWSARLSAHEPPKSETPAAEKNSEQEAASDLFVVPNGNPKELLDFITKMQRQRPKVRNRADLIAAYIKIQSAILSAADKILEADATVSQDVTAIRARLNAGAMLARISRDPKHSSESLAEFTISLEKDKRPEVVLVLDIYQLSQKVITLQRQVMRQVEFDKETAKQIVGELMEMLKTQKPDRELASLAGSVARTLEWADDYQGSADVYLAASKSLAESGEKVLVNLSEKYAGAARRMGLMGKPIDLSGTLLSGDKVDWSAYKGKVVLIDYWATWCGPCIKELPNVLENYKRYHDRGFDVLGISLDGNREGDREKVKAFVKDKKIPWKTLFNQGKETGGWNHPMAKFYGIMGIPSMMLVDRDGNVISFNARGPKLGKELEKLLGPTEDTKKDPAGDS